MPTRTLMRTRKMVQVLLILLFLLTFWTSEASAHTKLIGSTPAQDAKVDSQPKELQLAFNKPVESELVQLVLKGSSGQSVELTKFQVEEENTVVVAELPELENGKYTAVYRVVSTDGHPIEGELAFEVALPVVSLPAPIPEVDAEAQPEPGKDQGAGTGPPPVNLQEMNPDTHLGHDPLHQSHKLSDSLTGLDLLRYLVRCVYYVSMLLLLGFVLWFRTRLAQHVPLDRLRSWGLQLMRFHLLLLIGTILLHIHELTGVQSFDELDYSLFFTTRVGITWTILLSLSLLGFVTLFRWKVLDFIWLLLYIAAKTAYGHASSFEPEWLSLVNGAVHLLSAAGWSGGLLLLVLLIRARSDSLAQHVKQFSASALAWMVVLTFTGTVTVMIYLPSLRYLTLTEWGLLLGLKVAILAIVLIAALWMRRRLSGHQGEGAAPSLRRALGAEFTGMLMIAVLVGLLTHTSPLPDSDVVQWHEMGEAAHVTFSMTPGSAASSNAALLKVWLPDQADPPIQVQAYMERGKQQVELALKPTEGMAEPWENFPGYKLYIYGDSKVKLPAFGLWQVKLRIDLGEEQLEYERSFELY